MNLPNSLTLLRIFFIPVLVVVLLTREPNIDFLGVFTINFAEWGVLILLAAAATDWADGFYARRRSEVTTLGILLDPIADKLLMSAAFISLVEMHLVQGWMAVIIIGREIVVLGLRNIASAEGFTIPASALGKTKMVLQVIAVCAVILAAKHAVIRPLGVLLLWLVVGSAVVSAVQYF
jgi:CDP-diacylglycerol--glycerol-3-phosphate 3-phosphatidyltransferase